MTTSVLNAPGLSYCERLERQTGQEGMRARAIYTSMAASRRASFELTSQTNLRPLTHVPPGLNGKEMQFDYDSASVRNSQAYKLYPTEDRTQIESLVSYTLLGADRFYYAPGESQAFLTERVRNLLLERLLQYDSIGHLVNDTLAVTESPAPVVAPERYRWLSKEELLQDYAIVSHLLNDTLLGQDSFYGNPGQSVVFSETERYRWIKAEQLLQHYSLTHLLLDVLLGQDTIYTSPGQAPGINVTEKYRWLRREQLLQDSLLAHLIVDVLLGQDSFYGAPGEMQPSFDLTNPIPYQRAIELRTAIEQLVNSVLLEQDRLYGDPGQSITFGITDKWRSPRKESLLQDYELAHLLLDVLLGQDILYNASGQAPVFSITERYRDMKREELLQHDRLWHLLEDVLLGQDTIYGSAGQAPAYDLVIPVPILVGSQDRRTATSQNITFNLQGQDVFYGAAGQSPQMLLSSVGNITLSMRDMLPTNLVATVLGPSGGGTAVIVVVVNV